MSLCALGPLSPRRPQPLQAALEDLVVMIADEQTCDVLDQTVGLAVWYSECTFALEVVPKCSARTQGNAE